MQTYIVRVYRRDSDNKNEVAGIVEKVGTRQQHSFIDLSELQNTLERFIEADEPETNRVDPYFHGELAMND